MRNQRCHGFLGKSSGCVTVAKSVLCCHLTTAQPVVASLPVSGGVQRELYGRLYT